MPISTSSFEDERDKRYDEYREDSLYDHETIEFSGLTAESAMDLLKKLGRGIDDNPSLIEGIGWQAQISLVEKGVSIEFSAHNELLDDLIRRFEDMAESST